VVQRFPWRRQATFREPVEVVQRFPWRRQAAVREQVSEVLQRLSRRPNAGASRTFVVDEFVILDEKFAVRPCEIGGVDDVAAEFTLAKTLRAARAR
jgi:hypothetical protein